MRKLIHLLAFFGSLVLILLATLAWGVAMFDENPEDNKQPWEED